MGAYANHLVPESYRIGEYEWVGHRPPITHPARVWFLKRSEKSRKQKQLATTVHQSAEDCIAAAREEGCPHCVVQPHIQNPLLVLGSKVYSLFYFYFYFLDDAMLNDALQAHLTMFVLLLGADRRSALLFEATRARVRVRISKG